MAPQRAFLIFIFRPENSKTFLESDGDRKHFMALLGPFLSFCVYLWFASIVWVLNRRLDWTRMSWNWKMWKQWNYVDWCTIRPYFVPSRTPMAKSFKCLHSFQERNDSRVTFLAFRAQHAVINGTLKKQNLPRPFLSKLILLYPPAPTSSSRSRHSIVVLNS